MYKNMYIAIATLVGTVIGAGVLGIPYVVAKSGFLTGLLVLLFIGIAVLFVNLYLGEVVLRTKGNHQLAGYAEVYLGRWGKGLMSFSMIFGIYGALIAYVMGEGEVLKAIFNNSEIANSLIFFTIVATLVFLGLKTIGKSELIVTTLVIMIIVVFFVMSFVSIDVENLTGFNAKNIFLPYGVILFAFIGMAAIPEMKEELAKNRKQLKKAIMIGSLIPLVVYALFAVTVVGIVGLDWFNLLSQDERIATVALSLGMERAIGVIVNLFAVLAMGTSFLTLGLALKQTFNYDYGMNKNMAWATVCAVPLAVFLIDAFISDITSFISALDIAGSVSGGISGILIVLMFWKAKTMGGRKPEYTLRRSQLWGYILIAMFLFGMAYELLGLL